MHDPAVEPAGYLGLAPTDDLLVWRLPVVEALTTRGGFLFGGAGLGASVEVLEAVTGRPLVWATAQYLSHARPPAILDLQVTVAAAGIQTTQARVTGSVAGEEIFTVNAALGARSLDLPGSWRQQPDVPRPDDLVPREVADEHRTSIAGHMELRLADGRLEDIPSNGRTAAWARMEGLDMSAALLAVLGDMVPFGISRLLGMRASSTSLDNTLRIVRLVPSEWVLLDIRVHGVQRGFGHGVIYLWAEDGTLLGTASQSAIVRQLPSPP